MTHKLRNIGNAFKKTALLLLSFSMLLFILAPSVNFYPINEASAATSGQIIVGATAPSLEQYAAKELQRYLYERTGTLLPINNDSASIDRPTFVIGQANTNSKISDFVTAGLFTVSSTDPGP